MSIGSSIHHSNGARRAVDYPSFSLPARAMTRNSLFAGLRLGDEAGALCADHSRGACPDQNSPDLRSCLRRLLSSTRRHYLVKFGEIGELRHGGPAVAHDDPVRLGTSQQFTKVSRREQDEVSRMSRADQSLGQTS